MITHILLPTDGSALARAAVLAGVALAEKIGARVTGLFVAPPATPVVYRNFLPVGYDTPEHNAELIQKAAAQHLEVVTRAAKAAGVRCAVVSRISDFPADVILSVAKKQKCDLIVMGSHSRKGLAKLLLGSQTQKVLAQADIPVMVYR
jgi:nucleotide-binding universal stress UspA family protein